MDSLESPWSTHLRSIRYVSERALTHGFPIIDDDLVRDDRVVLGLDEERVAGE